MIRKILLVILLLGFQMKSAFAIDSTTADALSFSIGVLGSSTDSKLSHRVRIVIGEGIANNIIDTFLLTSVLPDGSLQGCVQKSPKSSREQFQRFVSKLRTVKYNPATNVFGVEYKLKCALLPPAPPSLVRVYQPDGSKQCEMTPGVSVDVMRIVLESQNIGVYTAEKVLKGGFVAQICGAATGYVNRYSIDPKDLSLAQSLGFILWDEM